MPDLDEALIQACPWAPPYGEDFTKACARALLEHQHGPRLARIFEDNETMPWINAQGEVVAVLSAAMSFRPTQEDQATLAGMREGEGGE